MFMPFNPTSAHFHHAFIYVFVRQNYKVNDRRPSWKPATLPLFASNTAMQEVKSKKYKTVKNIQHHTCSALHGHILAALSSELVPWGYRKICRKKSLIEKLISVRKPKQSPSLLLYLKPVSTIFTSLQSIFTSRSRFLGSRRFTKHRVVSRCARRCKDIMPLALKLPIAIKETFKFTLLVFQV